MARSKVVHQCSGCGAQTVAWLGRCPACSEWNTLEVVELTTSDARGAIHAPTSVLAVGEAGTAGDEATPTGIHEVDRALGGGLHQGSVTLLGGPPGIGKSTLLLQLAAEVATKRGPVLYVSAEESPAQLRLRAERLGCIQPKLLVAGDANLEPIVHLFESEQPSLAIIDSVQTISDDSIASGAGSVVQVRHVAQRLSQVAKRIDTALVLVGHVTKDGSLAGPRVLEHLVDTVLSFDSDRSGELRLLRAVKHRFGSTREVGIFEMTNHGLVAVPDASGRFLADRRPGVPGSVVTATVEGQRPLLLEVQALVAGSGAGSPRRSAQGVDASRMAMLLAVLDRRVGLQTSGCDVYVSVAGGAKVNEPAADLAITLAVASASTGATVPNGLVAIGEVGLAGEIRRVADLDRRLGEAHRLGFDTAAIPINSEVEGPRGMKLCRFGDLDEVVATFAPAS